MSDSNAMLFNLSCERHFPNKGTGQEICCRSDRGPRFRETELNALCEPFNGNGSCYSAANESGYCIPNKGDKNMLSN